MTPNLLDAARAVLDERTYGDVPGDQLVPIALLDALQAAVDAEDQAEDAAVASEERRMERGR